ncbi:YceD family protein [Williamsia sterculiae]|uniref:YceD family protein n=1 Tax=Williamsia sterculiae TaxID=1344003 RepID=UPI00097146D0|nr:DUF177 domain-containing protein [Williamsia sterculiae]
MSDQRGTSSPDVGTGGSPFVVDIRTLERKPGTMEQLHKTVVVDEPVGLDMIGIPAGSPIDLDMQLQSVSEGVLATGTVSGETRGQCARCLEPLNGTVNVFLTELFAYPDSETERTTDSDEVRRVDHDHIDLEQAVIDAVGLDLPMSPLCSDDCEGLCTECGVRLAIAEPGHHHDTIDPRWAALQDKLGDGDRPDDSPAGS